MNMIMNILILIFISIFIFIFIYIIPRTPALADPFWSRTKMQQPKCHHPLFPYPTATAQILLSFKEPQWPEISKIKHLQPPAPVFLLLPV